MNHARIRAVLVLAGLALLLGPIASFATEPKEAALSWKKQATDTRATVVGVAEELEALSTGDGGDAAGLIADAKQWLGKGDGMLAEGDAKLEAESFQQASYDYNMAWQYYVKAATAGLNARRILTGK